MEVGEAHQTLSRVNIHMKKSRKTQCLPLASQRMETAGAAVSERMEDEKTQLSQRSHLKAQTGSPQRFSSCVYFCPHISSHPGFLQVQF